MVEVDADLAYLAGLSFGDGYADYGQIRAASVSEQFRGSIESVIGRLATTHSATWSSRSKLSKISDEVVWHVSLNSTTLRRAIFNDDCSMSYAAMHTIAVESEYAAQFQAGLTDAEGSILPAVPIETPHDRIFALVNNDRRLLGIARLSLVYALKLEPNSVRIRLSRKTGSSHTTRGVTITSRKNLHLVEILSGAKKKWLRQVGGLLMHPRKKLVAHDLLLTYS